MDAFTSPEYRAALFDDAPVGLAFVGANGRWLDANDTFLHLLGYSRAELLRKTFQDITHPEDIDADVEMVNRLIAGNGDDYSMLKRYITKDRRIVWVHLEVRVIRDSQRQLNHFVSWVMPMPNGGKFQTTKNESNGQIEVRTKISLTEIILDNKATIWKAVGVTLPIIGAGIYAFVKFYHQVQTVMEKLPK